MNLRALVRTAVIVGALVSLEPLLHALAEVGVIPPLDELFGGPLFPEENLETRGPVPVSAVPEKVSPADEPDAREEEIPAPPALDAPDPVMEENTEVVAPPAPGPAPTPVAREEPPETVETPVVRELEPAPPIPYEDLVHITTADDFLREGVELPTLWAFWSLEALEFLAAHAHGVVVVYGTGRRYWLHVPPGRSLLEADDFLVPAADRLGLLSTRGLPLTEHTISEPGMRRRLRQLERNFRRRFPADARGPVEFVFQPTSALDRQLALQQLLALEAAGFEISELSGVTMATSGRVEMRGATPVYVVESVQVGEEVVPLAGSRGG